ncbi:polymeric immunoglobulin receptor-like [Brachyistius frenatus]|uniref:polymeric immunoglobulin receptor-like n=1 Tax=Brachyistius frenatus TaxID=100188 RepID=UPI0037E93DC1
MAAHLSVVLIFTGLTGVHGITSVSEVSVRPGGSITVPCLYDSQFTQHVKYLCKGYEWLLCTYTVVTNQSRQRSGKFSISDDKYQRVFTVTIDGLTKEDAHYWCVVERDMKPDVKTYFHLSFPTGSPELYVDHQEMMAFTGDDATINCRSSNSGRSKWCRLGGSCVTKPHGSIDGTRVSITKEVTNVFTVTMRRVKKESSGWYFCARGELQMPVHITVEQRPRTTTRQFITFSHTSAPPKLNSAPANESATPEQSRHHSASIYLLSFISVLSLLIITVSSFIWFMLKRCKQTKDPSAAATNEDRVMYTAVNYRRGARGKNLVDATGQALTLLRAVEG